MFHMCILSRTWSIKSSSEKVFDDASSSGDKFPSVNSSKTPKLRLKVVKMMFENNLEVHNTQCLTKSVILQIFYHYYFLSTAILRIQDIQMIQIKTV